MSKVEISIEAQIKDRITLKQEYIEDLFANFFDRIHLKYNDLNRKIILKNFEEAQSLSKDFPDLDVGGSGNEFWISSYSIISSITRMLTGRPLAFVSDEERNLVGVRFIPEGYSLKSTPIDKKIREIEIQKKPLLHKDNLFEVISDKEKFKEMFAVEIKKDDYQSNSPIYDGLVQLTKVLQNK